MKSCAFSMTKAEKRTAILSNRSNGKIMKFKDKWLFKNELLHPWENMYLIKGKLVSQWSTMALES